MPQIRGTLKTLTSEPSRVKELWIQARFVSAEGPKVIVPETRIIPVENGEVSFTAEENTAGTIVLVYEGSTPNTPIPIFIGENPSETLGAVINAARLEKNVSEDAIKKLISEALTAVGDAREDADRALKSAQEASQSASDSATSADASKSSAEASETSRKASEESATKAKSSEDASAKSASGAKSSEDASAKSATAAKASQDASAKSASGAKSSQDAASKSAASASTSATNAKASEDKSHEYMTQAQGYAQDANRGIPDGSIQEKSLSPELATKVNQGLTHVIGDISGLQEELDNKSAKTHTHEPSDINGVSGITSTVNNTNAANKLVIGDSAGRIYTSEPQQTSQIASKGYVDSTSSDYTTVAFRGWVDKGTYTPGSVAYAKDLYKYNYSKADFATTYGTKIVLNKGGLYRFDIGVSSRTSTSKQEVVNPFLYMNLAVVGGAKYNMKFAAPDNYLYNLDSDFNATMVKGGTFVQYIGYPDSEIWLGTDKRSSTSTFDVHLIITRIGSAADNKVN